MNIKYIEIEKDFETVEGIKLDKIVLVATNYAIDTVQFNKSSVVFRAFANIDAFLNGNIPLRGVKELPPVENSDAIVVGTHFELNDFFTTPITELCLPSAAKILSEHLGVEAQVKEQYDARIGASNQTPVTGEDSPSEG